MRHDNEAECYLLPPAPYEEEPRQADQAQKEENIACDEANIPTPSASSSIETESGIHTVHTRGQIAAYAGIGLSMSFRKHFFPRLILGRYARSICWDRRGAIVTRRFDYNTKNPSHMFNSHSERVRSLS